GTAGSGRGPLEKDLLAGTSPAAYRYYGEAMLLPVASRIGDIIVDCNDPELLAAFWCAVLGYRVFARDDSGVAIRGATVSPDILFVRVPEAKSAKNRLHFDVCPTDRGQAEELARLLALGAKRSGIVGSGSWVVLEDPEGNEFCLMSKQIAAEPAPFHEA
uniref:VOC family protein n=1 Tax=Paractinoplanes polyasparticus TaxID=2856853 RepID=UPI00210790F6